MSIRGEPIVKNDCLVKRLGESIGIYRTSTHNDNTGIDVIFLSVDEGKVLDLLT